MRVLNETAEQAEVDGFLMRYTNMLKEEVVEPTEGQIGVQWTKLEDENGEPFYKLKVSNLADVPGEIETTFEPDELTSPLQMRFRLLHLWSEVLQIRSHKLLQEMYEARDREERNWADEFSE